MINPEAVAFVGFEPINRDTMIGYMSSGLMQHEVGADEAKTTAIESVRSASKDGMVYSLLRVRHPNRLEGGTTTTLYACAAQPKNCECFPVGAEMSEEDSSELERQADALREAGDSSEEVIQEVNKR